MHKHTTVFDAYIFPCHYDQQDSESRLILMKGKLT